VFLASCSSRTTCPLQLTNLVPDAAAGSFFENDAVWKKAPILTGSTKFEPLPDVKNIMITGGAGFM
jgi:hypothetical protein